MTVTFISVASVSGEARKKNAKAVKKLRLPLHRGTGRLAVVGGGPSIGNNVHRLRQWNGGIWAVNGTINWCLNKGIEAYFYTIDAAPIENWTYDLTRITKAVLSPDCSPSLFKALKGASIELTALPDGGPTSAAAADWLAIECGYTHVTFFGCESCFALDTDETHAFESFPVTAWLTIKIGERAYRTKPEFIDQARIMSELIRELPKFYAERSGGLLRAMVEHGPDYEIIDMSDVLYKSLKAA